MVNNGCERDRDNSCKVVSILCINAGDESTSKPGKHVAAMAAMNPVFSRILKQHALELSVLMGVFLCCRGPHPVFLAIFEGMVLTLAIFLGPPFFIQTAVKPRE
jgi:hypothetical protein